MFRSHDRPRLALAGSFVLLALAVSAQGRYQDEEKKFSLVVKADPTATEGVTLRPNVRQKLYVSVENTSGAEETVTVQFRAGGKAELTGKAVIPAGETKEVTWTPAPGKKDPLDGPFDLVVLDKDGKALKKGDRRPLRVMTPYQYLKVEDAKGEGNRLAVKLSAGKTFYGPPARVSLDIPPDRVIGPRQGRFSGFLTKTTPIVLDAKNVRETATRDLRDSYSIQVDGIKRGLFFHATSGPDGTAIEPVNAARVGLLTPRVSRPTEKLAVEVLSSGSIADDDRIVVSVLSSAFREKEDPKVPDQYADVASFVGPRQVRMRADVGADSGLYVEPVTSEHRVTLDMSGVFGKTKVRVAIYPKAAFDAEGVRDPNVGVKADTDPTVQVILFDETPPAVELKAYVSVGATKETVKLAETKEAWRGRTLTIKASVPEIPRVTDVSFFLGRPGADGKLPADLVKGEELSEAGKPVWLVKLPIPPDVRGPVDVTAVATNELGLVGRATLTLPSADPVLDRATVAGRVFEADVPVDALPVVLLDMDGTELAAARSADGGRFAFLDVPPGRYLLFARREPSGSKGQLPIVVTRPTRADLGVAPKLVELQLIPQPKEPKKPLKGRIAGAVTENDRPIAGLAVQLIDAANRVIATATTNADGAFAFKDLEPGRYVVATTRSASRTSSRKEVELAAGQEKAGLAMKLFR